MYQRKTKVTFNHMIEEESLLGKTQKDIIDGVGGPNLGG